MSRQAIDGIVARYAQLFAAWGTDVTLERMRRDLENLYLSFGAGRESATVRNVELGGRPAERVTARGADDTRVILYLHGGGFSVGTPRGYRHLAADLSAASGASVIVLDYRLVPEVVFPGQLDDAKGAYRALRAQSVSADRIGVAGDSAGGGLTVALLVALRDDGDALPACAALLSPWADMECTGASYETKAAVDPVGNKAMALQMGAAYVGPAGDPRNPLASPIRASLDRLPPLKIQAGEREVFLDDARTLARSAHEAGVAVEFDEWPGMIHQWHVYASELPEARSALQALGAFFARHLGARS